MNLFRRIDCSLIAFCERGCHALQLRHGLSNYWIAGKLSLVASFLSSIGLIQIAFGSAPPHSLYTLLLRSGRFAVLTVLTVQCLMAVFLLYFGLIYWRQEEERSLERLSRGLHNPAKQNALHNIVRAFMLVDLVIAFLLFGGLAVTGKLNQIPIYMQSPFVLLMYGTIVVVGVFLYACDPLPPQLDAAC